MSIPFGELFMLGFRGAHPPPWMHRFASEYGLGGVILFDYDCIDQKYGRNVFSPKQLKELCAEIHALPSSPLVYVDQEGGKVRRLKEKNGFAPLASAQNFSTLNEAERQLRTAYQEMHALGIDCNLAPVVDLNINPRNPDLGAVERCYSDDPATVRRLAMQVAQVAREAHVGLCLKHFPGCGAATVNSHNELMDLTEAITPQQIDMFKNLLATIPTVLFSHGMVRTWDKENPVSVSPHAVQMVRAWAPRAVIITDDLQMEGLQKRMSTEQACVRAITAGADLICIGNNIRDEQANCLRFVRAVKTACDADPKLAAHAQASVERLRARKKA